MVAHCFEQYLLPRVALVIALGSFCASASGQSEYQSGRTTEIWITGKDVAVKRRLRQGHQKADLSHNDEFAKSMMKTADQSYAAGNVDAANWLARWARRLTNGRVGSREFAHPASPSIATPLEYAIGGADGKPLGILSYSEVKTPVGFEIQAYDPAILIPFNIQPDGHTERVNALLDFAQERHLPLVAEGGTRIANPPAKEPRATAGRVAIVEDTTSTSTALTHENDRQVALASSAKMPRGNTQHAYRAVPAQTNSLPLILASFASGVALCLLLCLVLFRVPVRLKIEHTNAPGRIHELPTDAPANHSLAKTTPRRRTARPSGDADIATDRQVENSRKKKSSIIEDVYRMNVELHQQCAS